jgi:hypothetical protein
MTSTTTTSLISSPETPAVQNGITEKSHQIDCLGGTFTGSQLMRMSPAIWNQISIEMFTKENVDFIEEFMSKIDMNAICEHFVSDSTALSEKMFMTYMSRFPQPQLLSCVNLTNNEFFKENSSKFGVGIRCNPHYIEWYNKWRVKQAPIGGGFQRKVSLEEKKSHPATPIKRRPQATDEERRRANLEAGIVDPFDQTQNPPKPSKFIETGKLPENAIKHPQQFVDLIENWNTEIPIYEYRDILPNTTLDDMADVKNTQFRYQNIELVKSVCERIPVPEKQLNPHAYFPLDGMWIAETDLGDQIQFIMDNNVVPSYILQHYKKEICEKIMYISGSKYLTSEFIMYFGEIMDWTRIDVRLYTPEIVANYSTRVFTKYVFLMKDFEQIPNKDVFEPAYKELMAVIESYKAQRESLLEKMARKAFVGGEEPIDMQEYLMSQLRIN